jgi:hypothetical protein
VKPEARKGTEIIRKPGNEEPGKKSGDKFPPYSGLPRFLVSLKTLEEGTEIIRKPGNEEPGMKSGDKFPPYSCLPRFLVSL